MLKQLKEAVTEEAQFAAAFRRLCVETTGGDFIHKKDLQPPSGGCVLKQRLNIFDFGYKKQPPSGGCVLKRS